MSAPLPTLTVDTDGARSVSHWRELVTQRVESMLGDDGPPGVAVALVIDGQPWASAIGYRDLARTQPLAADSLFYIYSVTKTMLAVATLDLVARGDVTLDQPVGPMLSDVAVDARLTVRQLLNHTGGVPDYGGMDAYHDDLQRDPARPWTSDAFLSRVQMGKALFAPGEGWAYSNIGYLLLRRIVEQITGASLRQILTSLIFEPLGLRHAFVADMLADAAALTPAYSRFLSPDDAPRDVAPLYHPGWVSHGVVAAPASELATFLEAIFAGRLVAPRLLAEMLHGVDVPESHDRFTRATYGLGLMIDPDSRYGLVAGHGGAGPGYSAGAFHFADVAGHRVTSVALVNSDQGDLGLEIAFSMVDSLAESIQGAEAGD